MINWHVLFIKLIVFLWWIRRNQSRTSNFWGSFKWVRWLMDKTSENVFLMSIHSTEIQILCKRTSYNPTSEDPDHPHSFPHSPRLVLGLTQAPAACINMHVILLHGSYCFLCLAQRPLAPCQVKSFNDVDCLLFLEGHIVRGKMLLLPSKNKKWISSRQKYSIFMKWDRAEQRMTGGWKRTGRDERRGCVPDSKPRWCEYMARVPAHQLSERTCSTASLEVIQISFSVIQIEAFIVISPQFIRYTCNAIQCNGLMNPVYIEAELSTSIR